jgi:hypothetical protein
LLDGSHLLRAHHRRDASVDHGSLETGESRTLLHLSLLKLAEELVFETFELHALLLVVLDLGKHLIRLVIDLLPRLHTLHLNEFVLLDEALSLLLADLLLAELRLIVVFLAHAIQVVLH